MNSPSYTKLTSILRGDIDKLRQSWKDSEAAQEFRALPSGTYIARILSGELSTARTGTPGYKLTFEIIDGDCVGRRVWHDIWLTEAAIAMAKRDLGKLGITALEQLETPFPQGLVCEIKVALRRDDDGTEHNRVRRFDVIRIDKPEDNPFAPAGGGA